MTKAIIIDDELHCISRLTDLLGWFCKDSIKVIAVCENSEDGIAAITNLNPDLVFLDVQLNETTGIDLLKQLPEINFEVIFTTAHEQYAVQAFKFSAIDYLLKPIDADDLVAAVSKLNKKVSQKELTNKFEALFQNLNHKSPQAKKITVPSGNGLLFLEVGQIIRCEADVNYTTIFLKDKQKIVVAKTLKEFEDMLTDHGFFRIHNSHLVNLSYISSYNKGKGGTVTLTDNTSLEVSTRRKELFMKRISEM